MEDELILDIIDVQKGHDEIKYNTENKNEVKPIVEKILDRMSTIKYELEQKGLFGSSNPKMEEYNHLGDELMKLIKHRELE